ncbi:MAG: hypothetical protein ACI4E5_07620 [Suilimivivens sp.]|nr:hypothetical protein [Lachnospiraceae bacterium]
MKRKIIVICAFITSLILTGMTAYAAPKTMPDGTIFDAEFYAETYPDIKAAVGTDEASLYEHYVQYGKAEGRKAVADTTTVKSTDTTQNASNQKSKTTNTKASVGSSVNSGSSDILVWVPTNGGVKYHIKSSCSNMKNPRQVSVETAIADGFTPCKKCY